MLRNRIETPSLSAYGLSAEVMTMTHFADRAFLLEPGEPLDPELPHPNETSGKELLMTLDTIAWLLTEHLSMGKIADLLLEIACEIGCTPDKFCVLFLQVQNVRTSRSSTHRSKARGHNSLSELSPSTDMRVWG